LLSNAFELMCLFCVPGTHDQKCTVVPFISTCYFARVVANTLCDVGFASRGLRFCVTRILGMEVPMTRDFVESWIKSHILSLPSMRPRLYGCWMEIQPSVELRSLCASCYIWRQCASICEENPRISGSYDPTKCQKNKIF
jgi:hypothetical protein